MNDNPAPVNPDPEAIRTFYDRFSSERSRTYVEHGNRRIEKAVARILPLVSEESTVLEIGCGTGLVAEQIARVAIRGSVWACDISAAAIALAQLRVKAANVQFRALDVSGGFAELKAWLPGPVDVVVLVDALEHLPLGLHRQFFENLAIVTHAGSTVVLTFPSPDYQRHLREHSPGELQIIDEIIDLSHLYEVTIQNGFVVKHFSLEDVWLPNQYVHCVLRRRNEDYSQLDNISAAVRQIAGLIRPEEKFILVDQDEWREKISPGHQAIPFLEHEGVYWGPPADDATAIRECERLRQAGARYIVFAQPSFWWLEHYAAFHRYLREQWPCVIENEQVVIFCFHH
jgi:SAM-dependent methyltransferase